MALQPRQRWMRTCGLLPRRSIDRSQALWPEKDVSGGIFNEFRSLYHRCCDLPKIGYYGSWCPWLRIHLLLLILLDSVWTEFHNISCCRRGLPCPSTSYCARTICCSGEVWSVDGHCLVQLYWLPHKILGRLLIWIYRLLSDRRIHPRYYWSRPA